MQQENLTKAGTWILYFPASRILANTSLFIINFQLSGILLQQHKKIPRQIEWIKFSAE
jgi:hypothetical protein